MSQKRRQPACKRTSRVTDKSRLAAETKRWTLNPACRALTHRRRCTRCPLTCVRALKSSANCRDDQGRRVLHPQRHHRERFETHRGKPPADPRRICRLARENPNCSNKGERTLRSARSQSIEMCCCESCVLPSRSRESSPRRTRTHARRFAPKSERRSFGVNPLKYELGAVLSF